MDIPLAARPHRADGRALAVAGLRDSPLSVDECLAAVALPEAGGTALFVGTVRDHDGGQSVVELEYVAHPSAERELAAVAREVADGTGAGPAGAGPAGVGTEDERTAGGRTDTHVHTRGAGTGPIAGPAGGSGGPAVLAVAVLHRTGVLAIGDIAVVAAASAAHRAEAFAACRLLIDEVKSRVPIWKRQVFADGAVEWVGACSGGHLR